MSEQEYRELHPGEIIQPGDEFCVSIGQDKWQPYPTRRDGSRVSASSLARRPIRKAAKQPQGQPITFEEVPGSRTTQETVINPQRERIAYEDLQPGDIIQEGDEWQHESGRWKPFASLDGSCVQVRHTQRARRPHNITMMLREFANQAEVLAEVRADEKRLFDDLELLRSEYTTVQKERDLARSEVARLSTELWARKPLEERIASLTHELANAAVDGYNLQHERDETRAELQRLQDESDELKTALRESQAAHEVAIAERNEAERLLGEARMERDKAWSDQKAIQAYRDTALQELTQAREASQQLLQTIADNADTFVDQVTVVERERDEARAERDKLQGLIDDLLDEPTARQVQDMLRTWATELDWAGDCFHSVNRDEIDTIQRTLIAVMERIETMINPEGVTDGE